MSMLVLAQDLDRSDHMGDGSAWWWVMGIGMMVVLVALVVVIVFAVNQRPAAPSPPSPTTRRPPEDLLAERFARGEIDEDEYRRRREALRE